MKRTYLTQPLPEGEHYYGTMRRIAYRGTTGYIKLVCGHWYNRPEARGKSARCPICAEELRKVEGWEVGSAYWAQWAKPERGES
jgi:hypothetical protein